MSQPQSPPLHAVAPDDTHGRVLWIDALRAWAILTIIFTHCYDACGCAHTGLILKMFFGSASLFFMTSGALVLPLRTGVWDFWWRRLRTYLPQLAAWSIVYALVAWHTDPGYNLTWHARWAFYAPTWGGGWFLYALTGLYLFVPFISPWVATASRRSVEGFLILWLASGIIPFCAANIDFDPTMSLLAPFWGFTGYMVAGFYLARWPLRYRSRKQKAIFWCITGALAVPIAIRLFVAAQKWGYPSVLDFDLSTNVMAMCLVWFAAFSYIRTMWPPIRFAATWLSVLSLELYLTHTAILILIVQPLGLACPATFALTLAIALPTSYLLHFLRLR